MKRDKRRELSKLARSNVGPKFHAELVCTNCHATLEAHYLIPREVFRCPSCGRKAAIRDDDAAGDQPDPALLS